MKCPKDKVDLLKKTYEGTVEIDQCPTCEGVWLDAGELEKIQEIKMNDYHEELARIPDYVGNAIWMAKSQSEASLICPVCGRLLERDEYGYCSQVLIDYCPSGHGVWLDKEELQALEIFYERCRMDAKDTRKGFFKGLLDLFR